MGSTQLSCHTFKHNRCHQSLRKHKLRTVIVGLEFRDPRHRESTLSSSRVLRGDSSTWDTPAQSSTWTSSLWGLHPQEGVAVRLPTQARLWGCHSSSTMREPGASSCKSPLCILLSQGAESIPWPGEPSYLWGNISGWHVSVLCGF